MPSDFGDESGEKFCDWLMDIGQQAGQEAMHAAARKLSVALKHTKGDLGVDEAMTASNKSWTSSLKTPASSIASLSMTGQGKNPCSSSMRTPPKLTGYSMS